MIQMTLAHAANILGLKKAADITFTGMSIDTRTLQPGNLFVAIAGDHVDGHDFIEEAYKKGAAAALVAHHVASQLPQIQVENVIDAMGKLGTAWRDQFTIPFIAVTGSNGKTTLKNMIA